MTMNLFALTQDGPQRVMRFALTANIQKAVEETFKNQDAAFSDYYQTEIPFDGKYKPDEGECLSINDYDDIDNVHGAIANPLSIPEIAPSARQFESIKALFSGYTSGKTKVALFQAFDRRRIISTNRLAFYHSAHTYQRVDGDGISLDTRLSMILIDKKLNFGNFHTARSIFDLSQYFKEATDTDLNDFASVKSINIEDVSAFIEQADSWTRRKVTLVSQSQILETVDPSIIKMAAASFNIDIKIEVIEGKSVIMFPAEKAAIKTILRFLDEDYYKSPLSGKNFLSNSKRAV